MIPWSFRHYKKYHRWLEEEENKRKEHEVDINEMLYRFGYGGATEEFN